MLSMVLNASYSYRIDEDIAIYLTAGLKLVKLVLLTGCQKCKSIYARVMTPRKAHSFGVKTTLQSFSFSSDLSICCLRSSSDRLKIAIIYGQEPE